MKFLKPTILMLVIVLLFSFSLFNGQPVKVRFFAWQSPELPLFLILIFDFALGFAIAFLWAAIRSTTRRRPRPPKKNAHGNIGEDLADKPDSGFRDEPPQSTGDEER